MGTCGVDITMQGANQVSIIAHFLARGIHAIHGVGVEFYPGCLQKCEGSVAELIVTLCYLQFIVLFTLEHFNKQSQTLGCPA